MHFFQGSLSDELTGRNVRATTPACIFDGLPFIGRPSDLLHDGPALASRKGISAGIFTLSASFVQHFQLLVLGFGVWAKITFKTNTRKDLCQHKNQRTA